MLAEKCVSSDDVNIISSELNDRIVDISNIIDIDEFGLEIFNSILSLSDQSWEDLRQFINFVVFSKYSFGNLSKEFRSTLATKLLRMCRMKMNSHDESDIKLVCNILTLCSSLFNANHYFRYLVFCKSNSLKIQRKATAMIGHLFKVNPPKYMSNDFKLIEYCSPFLNKQSIWSGKFANGDKDPILLISNIFIALNVSANASVVELAHKIKEVEISWFCDWLLTQLCDIQIYYRKRGFALGQIHFAYKAMRTCGDILEPFVTRNIDSYFIYD